MTRARVLVTRTRSAIAGVVVAWLAWGPQTHAQVRAPSDEARARALISEGDTLQYDRKHSERDYRESLARYDEAIALKSAPSTLRALAYAQRAGPLMRLGDLASDEDEKLRLYRDGQRSAERGIALDERCAWCWFWKGACLARWGQAKGIVQSAFALGELRSSLERSIEIDPGHLDARLALGQVHRQVPRWFGGDVVAAEASFRAVLKDEPRFTRAMLDLAELLSETGKKDEARQWARRALDEKRPSRPGEHRKFDEARARALLAELDAGQ